MERELKKGDVHAHGVQEGRGKREEEKERERIAGVIEKSPRPDIYTRPGCMCTCTQTGGRTTDNAGPLKTLE